MVKFQIGNRARRAAHRFSVHSADKAEEGLRRREEAQNVVSLVVQSRAANLDQAGIVGAAVEAKLP